MARSPSALPRSDDRPLIFGCVGSPVRRRKLESSLRDAAELRWFTTYVDLREALETQIKRVIVAVVDMEDAAGHSAHGFALTMSDEYPGIGIVVYRDARGADSKADVCMLGAAGVHDILFEGLTDEGYIARSIVLDACRRGAAELVMTELRKALPDRLLPFADAAVRNPSKGSIGKIAQHLNVHRQTPNSWCKKERYLRPEEVLVWCRLLLVAAMLELTSRTVESIAVELEYASANSLRNQLKNYTGMTATEIRASGLRAVVSVFIGRVAQRRAGFGGIIDRPADRDVIPLRLPNAG
jgi:AraC-like DNA-binding protein